MASVQYGVMIGQQLLWFRRGRVKVVDTTFHVLNSLVKQLSESSTMLVWVIPRKSQREVRIDGIAKQTQCVGLKVADSNVESMLKPTGTSGQVVDFQNYVGQTANVSLHTKICIVHNCLTNRPIPNQQLY